MSINAPKRRLRHYVISLYILLIMPLSPGKLEHVIDPFLLMYLISYNINNEDMKQINLLSWIRKKVI